MEVLMDAASADLAAGDYKAYMRILRGLLRHQQDIVRTAMTAHLNCADIVHIHLLLVLCLCCIMGFVVQQAIRPSACYCRVQLVPGLISSTKFDSPLPQFVDNCWTLAA